jgi:hypothetical protein
MEYTGTYPKKKFKKTGEFRPPKKGEFYLSGAVPEVYRALEDLESSYHIVRLQTPLNWNSGTPS